MDKAQVLKAEIRQGLGSKDASKLRKKGQIPAIVYGHKQEPVSIVLNTKSFREALAGGHRLMEIEINGKNETLLIKDVQYDYTGSDIIHVDLMRVDVTEMVRVTVPIVLKGTAKGAQEGGMVELHTGNLEIECRVTQIPEQIIVSVKEMVIGDAIHSKDIQLPDGVKLVSSPELLVATCHIVAEVKTTEEVLAEAPAAPEVITAAKEEPEEGEEAAEAKEPKEKKEKKEEKK
jgi:large subunit ribosomal protein L25